MLILAQAAGAPAPIANVLAATVVLQIAAIVFQAAVFMRTDLYAVLATVSGSRNLWALKTATFRRAIGHPTTQDQNLSWPSPTWRCTCPALPPRAGT